MMKYSKKLLAAMVCFALMIGLLAGVCPSYVSAAPSDAIKEELDELEARNDEIEEEISGLRAQLQDNLTELSALVKQKDLVDQEITLLYEQIENINAQITACSQQIADKQEELDLAQAQLKELQNKNALRIRAMEENGELSYWAVLAEANSVMELLDCLEMVADVERADKQCLQELNEAAAVVEEAKVELVAEQEDMQVKSEEMEEKEVQLEEKREETDELLVEMKAKGDEYTQMLEESEALQEELALEIAQKEEEYEEAKELETADTPIIGGSTSNVDGITWMMPCTYTAFTSPFGYRYHPISGVWKMHYGVDLAGRSGTPIVATRSGYVTTAAYQAGGAGYYVSLNHGDGFGSIYMHMTHYIVSRGQYVEQGQVIGYMGTTGGSTGVHLHFGISYNGTYVNPANYINIV